MDSMHPDPTPGPPPSLEEIRSQVARLEASHKARGLPLSGRIIHVCHHLPVEIIRVVPPSAIETGGILSPPMTPEFKPEDADPKMESVDARWRIHARTAHTAMISGMRSLSDSHENIVVAWTGEILLQTQSQPTPTTQSTSTFSSIADGSLAANGKKSPETEVPHKDEKLMVFGGEFSPEEKKELQGELERFKEVEAEAGTEGTLTYVPVFLPSDVSKGHYEGFCKKSKPP
jgi:trehalose 6-phosphate synthase/phosphatase